MKRQRWEIVWLVLLGVGMLPVGCGDDNGGTGPGNGSTPSEITFPLTIGNSWVHATATATDTTTIQTTAVDTTRIVGTETYDGESYYILEHVTPEGSGRALVRQVGQDILVIPVFEETDNQDPFQEWMDQITAASLPWKIVDLDAPSGSNWVVIDAESQFTLGGSDTHVRYELLGASLGRESVSVPAGNYTDVYHGEFTTRLTLSDSSGVVVSRLTSNQESWIADGVGFIKDILSSSAEIEGEEQTITKTSELSSYELQ